MKRIFTCIIIAVNLLFVTAYCQSTSYRFENITSEQGLADRMINAIMQDGQGYIWFGSEEGLTKYDGYSCTVYRHRINDPYSIADNEILSLCTDKEGVLWIGTPHGLS